MHSKSDVKIDNISICSLNLIIVCIMHPKSDEWIISINASILLDIGLRTSDIRDVLNGDFYLFLQYSKMYHRKLKTL